MEPVLQQFSPETPTEKKSFFPKKLTNAHIAGLAVGSILITILLFALLNALINRAVPQSSAPSPSPTSEVAVVTPSPDSGLDEIIAEDPSPTPTVKPSTSPTTTPKASATPTPSPSTSPTPTPTATPTTTVTLTNLAGQDGYVDSAGGMSTDSDIRVGRSASATIRGFAGFDLASIPKTAKIQTATLRVYQQSVTNNPYGPGGTIIVDHLDYGGSLSSGSYNGGNVYASNVGTISSGAQTEWKTLNVTDRVKHDLGIHTSSQYRLRFTTETTGSEDYASFAGPSQSNPPQLVISYY